jgi:hypothetical protein
VVLARQVGVSHLVVALNKADVADEEMPQPSGPAARALPPPCG